MKLKILNILFIMVAFISSAHYLSQNSSNTLLKKLDIIFNSDKITIIIQHHGGYTATYLGKSTLQIKKTKNDSIYSVHYKDAIDRKKLSFTVNPSELSHLKTLFTELIAHHNPNKKLSGDCLTIDKNYLIKSSEESITIKPSKDLNNAFCIINWIYEHELKTDKQ